MSDEEKPPLTPANENPWYCLATVYGEQEKGALSYGSPFFDVYLATQNRQAWNWWMAAAISEEQRAKLTEKNFNASELTPFSPKERDEFIKVFAKRTSAEPPDPFQLTDFQHLFFQSRLCFECFLFPTNVLFVDSEFASGASFRGAAFLGYTILAKVFFKDEMACKADFSNVTFFEGVTFFGSAFSEETYFCETVFFDRVEFMACEFKSHTKFDGAKFLLGTPDFRDAKMCEATEWHDAQWPPSPKSKEAAQDQVYAYERLKAEMERLKKYEDEQSFFAKELRARRALLWFKWLDGGRADGERTKSAFGALLNWAYEVFSGYGLSIGSPLFWLVVLFAVGADIFAWAPVHKGIPLPYDVAESLSLTNLLPLLPYKVDNDIIIHLSPLAKIIGNLQSFLAIILLFLLGLALRNRFRMK